MYQRNLVEFIAKEKLNLPLQITGSLFAIRTIILKAIKFSHDICEDWDLTLDIYLSEVANNLLVSVEHKFAEYKKTRKINYDKINNNSNKTKHNGKIQKIISFRPILISYSEITYNIMPYFRQRMRVSEVIQGVLEKIIKIVKKWKTDLLF